MEGVNPIQRGIVSLHHPCTPYRPGTERMQETGIYIMVLGRALLFRNTEMQYAHLYLNSVAKFEREASAPEEIKK